MHRPAISIILFAAFAASAVFGLCAMTQQMMMHGGMCATGGIGSMVCPENPMRHLSLLVSLLAVLAVVVYLFAVSPVLSDRTALSVPHWRERELLSWAFSPGLQPLFSDGILNPKTY